MLGLGSGHCNPMLCEALLYAASQRHFLILSLFSRAYFFGFSTVKIMAGLFSSEGEGARPVSGCECPLSPFRIDVSLLSSLVIMAMNCLLLSLLFRTHASLFACFTYRKLRKHSVENCKWMYFII